MATIELISSILCFNGKQERYKHWSNSNSCEMTFSVYTPPNINENNKAPVLYWLSGLTCNDENFVQKAGAQKYAAELGIIIVTPDTSPRGEDVADDPDASWDFGLGAGFYINATQEPWSAHYHMFDYVTQELPTLINDNFSSNGRASISGHSMGGHGALVCGLRTPENYCSVSAFAPIVNPMQCPWGKKAFSNYLGDDESLWQAYDTCEIVKKNKLTIPEVTMPVLINQGVEDGFLEEQLLTENLQKVAEQTHYDAMQIHLNEGYEHSYFFIASFIEEHLKFHAQHLKK